MSSELIQSRVRAVTKLTAVSSNPSEAGQIYPLTAVDHVMGRHSAAVVLYYGENPGGSFVSNPVVGSFVLDPLRASLSEVLTKYPKVTGRISRSPEGNWTVTGNDAGVRVTTTNVAATLDEWLRSADAAEETHLAPLEQMPEDPYIWSHFHIQINEFEGGGVAIGVSFSHLNADPTSATFLLKAWADAHQGQPVSPPLFNSPFPRNGKEIPNTATKSTNFYANKSKATHSPAKMASVTFKFSNSTIKQCFSEIKDHCSNATPFDFLAALFWKRVLRLKGPKNEQNCSLSICTDFRKLFQSSLSHRYFFGNALHFSQLSVDPKEMDQCELGHVAGLLHSHMQRLSEEEEEIWSTMEWLESQKEKGGKYAPAFKMYGPELTCVSMEHMVNGSNSLMYETKFVRDSKPVHVSYNVGNAEGEGLIVVMPSNEGGVARNVMVMLPEREVAELCEDQAILSLKPTMLLGGRQS